MTPPHASDTHQNQTNDDQTDDRRQENENTTTLNPPLDQTADKTCRHKYILIKIQVQRVGHKGIL